MLILAMKEKTINRIGRALVLAAAMLSASEASHAQLANSPWPKPFANLSNSTVGSGYGANGKILWSYATGAPVGASVVIGADGTVYTGSWDNSVYALAPQTGALKWKFTTGSAVPEGPTIGSDGTVYFGSMDGNVYAVDGQTGKAKWKFVTGGPVTGSPTLANGMIYIGSDDGYFYGIDAATGRFRFQRRPAQMMTDYTVAAIESDGTVVYGSTDGYLCALNGQTGDLKWKVPVPSNPENPVIGPDGTIYVVATNTCYAFTSSGVPKWSFQTIGGWEGSVSFGSKYVYVLIAGSLYALNPSNGTAAWSYNIGGDTANCLAVAGDGTVYGGTVAGNFVALDGPTGSLKWSIAFNNAIYGCPAIGGDGTLYLGLAGSSTDVVAIQSDRMAKLEIDQPVIAQGGTATATLTAPSAAPSGGTKFQLTSSGADVSVPTSVTIPAGKTTASFSVTATSSTGPATVTISAQSSNGQGAQANLNVFFLSGLSLNPSPLYALKSSTGTIAFSCPAPESLTINLSETNNYAQIPASVSVTQGATQATFIATAANVTTPESDTLSASFKGGVATKITVTVDPIILHALTVTPATVLPGAAAKATVSLTNPSPKGGTVVSLSSSESSFTLPSSVTVPAGATTATFNVTAPTSTGPYTTTVTAAASSGPSVSASLTTVVPSAVSFSPSAIDFVQTSTGTVTLSAPAPQNVTVKLSNSSSQLSVPSSVTVLAGQSSATFTAKGSVTVAETATITASLLGATASGSISLGTAYLSQGDLTLTPSTIPANTTEMITGTVTINAPAPAGGLTLTIAYGGRGQHTANFPKTVVVPAGATSATFTGTASITSGRLMIDVTAPDSTFCYAGMVTE